MAEMNSGISDILTTIDESSQGVNDAADSVGGIVDSINDIEKMLQKIRKSDRSFRIMSKCLKSSNDSI